MMVFCGYVGEWVVGVGETPVMEGRAVIVEWVVLICYFGCEIKPLAFSAVEILGSGLVRSCDTKIVT